jgi:uncharacterized protein YndB with AHSA1/START domain
MTYDLTLERSIDAPPEVVFDAFTDSGAQHDLYADAPDWVVESECDLRVGGRWTIVFGPPGRKPARETNVFEEIERPRRLVYRSTMALPDGSTLDTRIEATFEPDGGRTRVRVVQSGFPAAEMRDEYASGWTSILDALARVAATRAAG